MRKAARRAAEAQRSWAAASYSERAAVLRRAGDLWNAHAEEIKTWLTRETGAIPPMGDLQVHVSAEECYEAAALASQPYGELLRTEQPRLSMARRVPAGVVGVIAPFNVPTILSIRSVAPALALGNAVILKPDPRTSVTGGVILAEIFTRAGLPDGLLHVLPGGPGTGEAVVTEPGIRVIAFTGSTRAGRAVARLAGEHLKRVHLELGGNSALIVLPDVDVERATSVGAFGSFIHQGQICMSASRHLVHSSIAKDYAMALAARADHLPVGDPNKEQVALGPLIDEQQRDHVHRIVTGSIDAGALLLSGGTYQGLFYRPTVLADVPTSAPAYAEEIFGPVAPVTPFDSIDEAVEMAGGHRLRAVARDPDPGRLPGPGHRRADPVRAGSHQRPDRQRRGDDPVRRGGILGQRRAARRGPGQPGRLHRDAVGGRAGADAGASCPQHARLYLIS